MFSFAYPDSKVHGANMGPIWGRDDPGGTHVGPMSFAIWVVMYWPVLFINMFLFSDMHFFTILYWLVESSVIKFDTI